jgi:DNA-binding PadR family transcriptional regulator
MPDPVSFEAETAALSALANLRAEGPATARNLLRRIQRAAAIAGETWLPYKHATLYAVLHELEFDGFVSVNPKGLDDRKVFAITSRGRVVLAQGQERWRAAHLVIKASATSRESADS